MVIRGTTDFEVPETARERRRRETEERLRKPCPLCGEMMDRKAKTCRICAIELRSKRLWVRMHMVQVLPVAEGEDVRQVVRALLAKRFEGLGG